MAQIQWGTETKVLDGPAAAFLEVDGEQNIYLVHEDLTSMTKYLAAYQYDSLLAMGGKSHREEGFLEIGAIDVSNRQSVFVLDQGRQRITLLHPNLRVIQDLNLTSLSVSAGTDAPDDLLVRSLASNSAGELFLLNVLDNRIYVLSASGGWSLIFGGTDYGEGSLFDPSEVSLSADNFLFVGQPDRNNIQVYDLFGTWRYAINTPESFSWTSFQLAGEVLILRGTNEMMILDPRTDGSFRLPYPLTGVLDFFWGKDQVYFLTKNQVHLYPLPERD